MQSLKGKIVRFADESFPGWVACEFVDANGVKHEIIDKVPIFTTKVLWSDSEYPLPGWLGCDVLRTWSEANIGLAEVRLRGSETEDGRNTFVVLQSELTDEEIQ